MSQIKTVEYSTNYDWAAGTGTFTDLGDFLADSLEPGLEDILTVDMGDGTAKQDGVQLSGEIRVESPGSLSADTRTWLKFTPYSGTAKVVGGVDGCRIAMGDSALRPSGGGPPFTRVTFTAAGSTRGDTIKSA